MSADVNTFRAPDPIDPSKVDTGKSAGKKVTLPVKGPHQLQTILIACGNETRTQEGYLKATLTYKVVGGKADGYEMRYQTLSAKKYSNRESNQFIDYLRANGIQTVPQTDADYIALVQSTLNHTFTAGLNWEAKDPDTYEVIVKDMDGFPLDEATGERQQFVIRKNDPENKRIWARARVTYYRSTVTA